MECFFIPFVSGIAEHDALVTCSEVLKLFVTMDSLGNIGILSFNDLNDFASCSVHTLDPVIITNLLAGVPDNLLKVDLVLGDSSLSHESNDFRLSCGFHSNLGIRVNSDARIHDGV